MPSIRNAHKLLDPEIRAKNREALRLWSRGILFDVRQPDMPDPVFVIGCSRSGTTVTYETLSASNALLSFGYEIPQFWNSLVGPATNGWASEAAASDNAKPEHRRAAQRFFYQRFGQGRVLDKTCINVMRADYLWRLFPNASFVYIHRDGRDNVSSMMDGWRDGRFSLTQFHGPPPEPVTIEQGEFREWHFFLPPGWRDYNRASLEEVCAFQWITANRMALEAKALIPESRWIQLRYEDIFDQPVDMFAYAFERLGIRFDAALEKRCRSLDRRPTSIVSGTPAREKWKGRNREAIERVTDMLRPTMSALGYEC